MADPTARALVEGLKAAGLSGASIARAIGRDASLINQISRGARGEGYGQSIIPALRAMSQAGASSEAQAAAAARSVPIPRRTTSDGRQARTRQPVIDTVDGRQTATRTWGAIQQAELERAAAAGQDARLVVTLADGTRVTYWQNTGWSAQSMLSSLRAADFDFDVAWEGWDEDSPYGGASAASPPGGPTGSPVAFVEVTYA